MQRETQRQLALQATICTLVPKSHMQRRTATTVDSPSLKMTMLLTSALRRSMCLAECCQACLHSGRCTWRHGTTTPSTVSLPHRRMHKRSQQSWQAPGTAQPHAHTNVREGVAGEGCRDAARQHVVVHIQHNRPGRISPKLWTPVTARSARRQVRG